MNWRKVTVAEARELTKRGGVVVLWRPERKVNKDAPDADVAMVADH